MKKEGLLIVLLTFFFISKVTAQDIAKIEVRIIGHIEKLADSIEMRYCYLENPTGFSYYSIKRSKMNLEWIVNSREPIRISFDGLKGLNIPWFFLAEPGDSIVIESSESGLKFYGRGSEKYSLINKIFLKQKGMKRPSNPFDFNIVSVNDYWEWDKYLNEQVDILTPIVDSFKNDISFFAYEYLKAWIIKNSESGRHDKFLALYRFSLKNNLEISRDSLCKIYDSSFFKPSAVWFRSLSMEMVGDVGFIEDQIRRRQQFIKDDVQNSDDYKFQNLVSLYEQGKEQYIGLARERFFQDLIRENVVKKIRAGDLAETLLTRYYAEPGNPRYKDCVKKMELRERVLKKGQQAPDFSLIDIRTNHKVTRKELEGKLVLMNFIDSNFDALSELKNYVQGIKENCGSDSNLIVLNIYQGKTKDIGGQGDFLMKNKDLNFYRQDDKMISWIGKQYNVLYTPCTYLLDDIGRVIIASMSLDQNNVTEVSDEIKRHYALLQDGPYIITEGGRENVYTVNGHRVVSFPLDRKKGNCLEIVSDNLNKRFKCLLKDKLEIEPSIYESPERMFIVSDIEGNFKALREILQANKIIDSNFNWIFGKGHLVCNGDFFDRGQQVTEVLWLIYALEQKAKAEGGYVHFILGNHEIMNLSGKKKYVQAKYHKNVLKIKKEYQDLYSDQSELGRWLRTKNIIEKIGDVLFMHGGMSKEFLDLHLPLTRINELARPYYALDDSANNSSDKEVALMYNIKFSPFWYRNYYMEENMKIRITGNGKLDTAYKTPQTVINETLRRYNVSAIVTGHTHVQPGDKVTAHYGLKVFNTDTYHANGESEALLIENKKYYRVNYKGDKFLLSDMQDNYAGNP